MSGSIIITKHAAGVLCGVSDDSRRPHLTKAHLRKVKDSYWLESTDSYKLVRIKVEHDGEPSVGLLAAEPIKRAATLSRRNEGGVLTIDDEYVTTSDGVRFPRSLNDASTVFPDVRSMAEKARDENGSVVVGFNPSFLSDAARAMGGSGRSDNTVAVYLHESPLRPALIVPAHVGFDEAHALVMPVKINT